jgi:hypothetical protein
MRPPRWGIARLLMLNARAHRAQIIQTTPPAPGASTFSDVFEATHRWPAEPRRARHTLAPSANASKRRRQTAPCHSMHCSVSAQGCSARRVPDDSVLLAPLAQAPSAAWQGVACVQAHALWRGPGGAGCRRSSSSSS